MCALRCGDFVEVRSFAEIAATLDGRGELGGLPFMPEMLPYCGKRYEVWKRADKTCDEASGGEIRRLRNIVHLKGLRCSGEAHSGCDAGCLLFWKEQWLKGVASLEETDTSDPTRPESHSTGNGSPAAVRALIQGATRRAEPLGPDGKPLYSCQSTEIGRFSEPLPWWDMRQYIRDIRSRNFTFGKFATGLFVSTFNKIQGLRGRRGFAALVGPNTRTPQTMLDVVPGDLVRIKPRDEIAGTLDCHGRNRGLSFRPVMAPYCGKRYRVLKRVGRIIDPRSRKMIDLHGNCLILDGVVCGGEMRRFCPRAGHTFWRDVWLEKVCEPPTNLERAPRPAAAVAAAAGASAAPRR